MRRLSPVMLFYSLLLLSSASFAQSGNVSVADANGNKLRYSFDSADGPATFTGIDSYATDESKAGHIIIADNVIDADGNTHEVNYIGGSISNRNKIISIVFGQNIIATGGSDGNSNDAFYACPQLRKVTLNNRLETLGRYTFQSCNSLEDINLGDATGLKTIMLKAFQNADNLRSLELPESVSLIEESAFEGCDSLRSFTFLGMSSLTNIPKNCFAGCVSLENITLPDAVKTLSAGCFYNTPSLTEIIFGTGITSLSDDNYVFGYFNANLKKMTFPGAVYPFLKEYYLPSDIVLYVRPDLIDTYKENSFTKKLHFIGIGQSTAFDITTTAGGQLQVQVEAQGDANNVIQLTVTGPINGTDIDYLHSAMPNISILDLTNARIVAGGDSYHQWEINNGTATQNTWAGPWNTETDVVGSSMFYNMPTLTSLSLPSGVTTIGDYALAQDKNKNFKLAYVTIPSGVTAIGRNAFYCTGITEITLPVGVTVLEQSVFESCEKLRKATLPEGLKVIGAKSFNNCYVLEDINMPSTVESIENEAFINNYQRSTPLTIPASCKRIGDYVFYNNYAMPGVTFCEGLESIGYYAFYGCHNIRQVLLPESVTQLGNSSFYDCDSLRTFTFPQNIKDVPAWILQSCDALASVTLADGTTGIGQGSFADCPMLNTINYNQETLTSVSSYAFRGTGFTDVSLPSSVTSLGSAVFSNCAKLVSVNIPPGVDFVPDDYVSNCPKLVNVIMHEGIRTIGNAAFYGCISLPSIDLNNQITVIGNNAFNRCTSLVLQKLPDALTTIGAAAFRETSAITIQLTIPSAVTLIDAEAFIGSGISAVILPDGPITLGRHVFANTRNLTAVQLPSTIKRIPNYAFQQATSLRHIDLPPSVEEIGYCAFDQSALEEITLPDSVKTIEGSAFSSTNLRTFRVPDHFTSDLGSYCLNNCKRLKTVYFGRNQDYSQWQSFTCCNGCDSLELMRVYAGTPPLCSSSYMGYRTNCILEVPEDQVALYKEADNWKDFKEIRGFFSGDVLNDQDFALLQTLYQTLDGANWTTSWDLTNNHHATGKWPGVTTENTGGETYYITAINLPASGLKGQLTADIFQLTRLQTLDLSENNISGNIGNLFTGTASDLAPLTDINLKANLLTGDIYPFASRLPELTKLDVSFNRLTTISQPISKDKLNDFVYNFQFIDYWTHEVVDCDEAEITDVTVGVPTKLTPNTLMTYRHDNQDYGFTGKDLARLCYDGYWYQPWATHWELYQTDSLWNLYAGNDNYVFSGPKNKVQAYVFYNGNWETLLLRMNWTDGDVNADQDIDVTDLQSVIYYAMNEKKPTGQMFNYTTADVNADNAIDIRDVVGNIDYILGYVQSANAKRYGKSQYTELNEKSANKLTVSNSSILFNNTESVAALQFLITGASAREINIKANLRNNFSIAMRDIPGGVRVVIYSATGNELPPGQYELVTNLPANAVVTDARLSDKNAKHLGVNINNEATGINAIKIDEALSGKWHDLNGRVLNVKPTQPGIYIKNGKKVIIK